MTKSASFRGISTGTMGTSSPVCMRSATVCSRRPSAPPGCSRAKSSSENPFSSKRTTASASPIAKAAVVEAVGARPSGHASSGTPTSSTTSAYRPRVESGFPVIAITGSPILWNMGSSRTISSVSPELERATTTSPRRTMPRSPWIPSPACRKKAGVPVEAIVAAIFRPISPDFPMPVTTTFPRADLRRSTAFPNLSSTFFRSP